MTRPQVLRLQSNIYSRNVTYRSYDCLFAQPRIC